MKSEYALTGDSKILLDKCARYEAAKHDVVLFENEEAAILFCSINGLEGAVVEPSYTREQEIEGYAVCLGFLESVDDDMFLCF